MNSFKGRASKIFVETKDEIIAQKAQELYAGLFLPPKELVK